MLGVHYRSPMQVVVYLSAQRGPHPGTFLLAGSAAPPASPSPPARSHVCLTSIRPNPHGGLSRVRDRCGLGISRGLSSAH